jgi:D-serine deaminase-like pyridoxal phosphate-dependent protein
MLLAGLTEDGIALVVAARVVSAPRPGEAVLDCGSKALSSDRPGWLDGYGQILEAPGATIVMLSEEHAVVRGHTAPLRVGDLVRVIPNHVCTVVNLTSELLTADGDDLTGRWQVTARR